MPENLKPSEADVATPASDGFLFPLEIEKLTLARLPLGARLLLECRKDWRTASVSFIGATHVALNVCAPSGRTYRLRRPADAVVAREGGLLILGSATAWRVHLCRYDMRW